MSLGVHVEANDMVFQDKLSLADLSTDKALPLSGVPVHRLNERIHIWGVRLGFT